MFRNSSDFNFGFFFIIVFRLGLYRTGAGRPNAVAIAAVWTDDLRSKCRDKRKWIANFIVVLMTIFRAGNDQLDVAADRGCKAESGPSNLCYNPFGSRGDGTFRRRRRHHKKTSGEREAPEWRKETTVGQRIKQPDAFRRRYRYTQNRPIYWLANDVPQPTGWSNLSWLITRYW